MPSLRFDQAETFDDQVMWLLRIRETSDGQVGAVTAGRIHKDLNMLADVPEHKVWLALRRLERRGLVSCGRQMRWRLTRAGRDEVAVQMTIADA